MRRRPALCLLTSILALLTAVTLIGSAFAFAAPRAAVMSSADVAVVHAFYKALNSAIRTGDSADLRGIVAVDFVAHETLPGVTQDRAGLERYLTAVHAAAPATEIVVNEVTTAGNRALAQVVVADEEEAPAFLGVPLRAKPPVWGTVDAFRIDGRQVVEHWGGTTGLALFEPLGQTAMEVTSRERPLLSLDRLSIPAGGSFAARVSAMSRLLYVESGAVAVTSTPIDKRSAGPATERLSSGDNFIVPTWSRTELRNDGTVPASILVVAAIEPSTYAATQDQTRSESQIEAAYISGQTLWPNGIPLELDDGSTITPLAGNLQTTLPSANPVVAIGRATLTPGADLVFHQATGPSLLFVEAGVLDLTVGGDGAWIRHAESGGSMARAVDTLATGDGALLETGAITTLANRGSEPVVLTVVAVLPPGAPA